MKHIRFFLSKTVIALLVICMCTAAAAFAGQPEQEEKKSAYTDLLEFEAKTLDGEVVNQEIFEDYDVTILYFWATYCGYCVDEMDEIAAFMKEMPENVQLISICGDGIRKADIAKSILEETGLDAPAIVDANKDFARLFGQVIYTPTVLFVDKEGHMVGEELIGAPADVEAAYTEYLTKVFEELDIEMPEKEAETSAETDGEAAQEEAEVSE